MSVAILYVPDAASAELAVQPVAGRSLAFRAAVAAARAGAALVGIPRGLRSTRLEREVDRAPEAARAVRWLDGAAPAPGFTASPCVLVPASALAEAPGLRALIARGDGARGAVLDGTAAAGAPVLVAPPALVEAWWPVLAAGRPL